MNITSILDHQWDDVRSFYLEAFPKAERKPFFTVRRSVKKGKAKIYTASENNTLLGFVMVIPYKNLVMVELQKYALGKLFFRLSKIKIAE